MKEDVIAERLSNLIEIVTEFKEEHKEFKDENKACHNELACKQDYTNGRVRFLEKWRMYILGILSAGPIVASILGWIFLQNMAQTQQQIKNLDNRLQAIEDIIVAEN